MKAKNTLLFAKSLEVVCPHCEGAQPDPDLGSFLWTEEQILGLTDEERTRACVECDESIRIEIVRPMPLETATAARKRNEDGQAQEV